MLPDELIKKPKSFKSDQLPSKCASAKRKVLSEFGIAKNL
jgi:hypothetical protein